MGLAGAGPVLPGVGLRGFAWAWPDPVESLHGRSSNCTESAPRSACSSSIVIAPTIVEDTTGLRSSHANATAAGLRTELPA